MPIDPDAVLATLTLEQKVSLLAGFDAWHTMALPGVPPMRCSDGPAGVRGTTWTGPASASFPCATTLGATFDPALVEEVGDALGREARSKGVHMLLAPTVNLHRTPIGGRNFECMSEDPVVTSRLSTAYVRGVQSHGVACCIKHFVANDTEHERHTISSEVDEATLRELYLQPFEHAVRPVDEGGAGVRAVMSSYNRINGTYASEHHLLLRGVLRDEWGFDGVVVSDWHGTHSAADSLEAGLDLEMPGPARERGDALLAELQQGLTTEARVDESVLRLLRMFEWSGVGEIDPTERTDDSPATRAVIRRAAIEGSVLLKNDGILPLPAGARIALLGPNAAKGQVQGGGSARVRANRPSMPLAALDARGVVATHEQGCRIEKRLPSMRGEFAVHYHDLDGGTAEATSDRLSFIWFEDPAEGIDQESMGAHIEGTFTPQVDGEWTVSLTAVGSSVLRIDGQVLVDLTVPQTGGAYFGLGSQEIRVPLQCRAGEARHVDVTVAAEARRQVRGLAVGAAPPDDDDAMGRAVAAAAAAPIAVVVVGTNADWETEGEDRTTMELPGAQDELVRRVAAVNPRTVVVVNAGSPVTMPWLDDVAAVLQVWFPGEEFGEALADVLLGVAEPGGRLPVTVPARLDDTPAFAHHPGRDGRAVYAEGPLIGHRWYEAQGITPVFPFGHGLGYTTWSLGEATLSGDQRAGVTVTVPVQNTGDRAGSTVVQCYVGPEVPEAGRPLRTLQGFVKLRLGAGESGTATVTLSPRAFSRWEVGRHDWVIEPGAHTVSVGTSSQELTWQGSVNPAAATE